MEGSELRDAEKRSKSGTSRLVKALKPLRRYASALGFTPRFRSPNYLVLGQGDDTAEFDFDCLTVFSDELDVRAEELISLIRRKGG